MPTTSFAQRQFRNFLKREFSMRQKKNPRYSLRAYSRDLDFDQSHLSKLLNGVCPVTRKTSARLQKQFGDNPRFRKIIRHLGGTISVIENEQSV